MYLAAICPPLVEFEATRLKTLPESAERSTVMTGMPASLASLTALEIALESTVDD